MKLPYSKILLIVLLGTFFGLALGALTTLLTYKIIGGHDFTLKDELLSGTAGLVVALLGGMEIGFRLEKRYKK